MTSTDHTSKHPLPPTRRDFLKRSLGASLTALVAAGGAAALYDNRRQLISADSPPDTDRPSVALPSYAVERPPTAKRLVIAHGPDPVSLLQPALKQLGGIEAFVRPGDVVLIKPNIAFASPPLIGATTNPDLVAAVVRLCLAAGAARVIVTDNPINQPERCFTQTRIGPAARAAGAKLVMPTPSAFAPVSVTNGKLIRNWPLFYEPLARANKVIGITPVKDHSRAAASMTMKNWYGLLGGRRNQFHQDINNIIKELAMMITPTLVILDGTRVMIDHGPTGGSLADIVRKDTLIISTDQVAADAVGYTLLQRDPNQLQYLKMATDLGLGNLNYRQIPHVEFNLS